MGFAEIQNILGRYERLEAIIMLAVTLGGTGVIRSNIRPERLKEMADLLVDAANQADERRPDGEPLN